jgi:hypothetical protein
MQGSTRPNVTKPVLCTRGGSPPKIGPKPELKAHEGNVFYIHLFRVLKISQMLEQIQCSIFRLSLSSIIAAIIATWLQ